MKSAVVDTNVAVCANGLAGQASPACVIACVDRLVKLMESGQLVIDDGEAALGEYASYFSRSGQPGPGHVFFKWVVTNRKRRHLVREVAITPDGDSYKEYPSDADLANLDRSDHKWVAIAIAAAPRRRPAIVNATDTDWLPRANALARHRVRVEQLCPELMVLR